MTSYQARTLNKRRNDDRPTREKTWCVVSWLPPDHPRRNDDDVLLRYDRPVLRKDVVKNRHRANTTFSTINMAFVHRQSCEGVKSELDIFSVPPTVTSIETGQWVEHQPTASLDSGGPIEFFLPGSGDAYLDPVGPVNNWLHSLFSQVDVYLNDTLVTPSTNTYPFRANIETALSYGTEANESQLTSQLWYKDTAGRMETVDVADEAVVNARLISRRNYTTQSHVVEMMGATARVPVSARPFPTQRCRRQDPASAKQGHVRAHGRWSQPKLQRTHR